MVLPLNAALEPQNVQGFVFVQLSQEWGRAQQRWPGTIPVAARRRGAQQKSLANMVASLLETWWILKSSTLMATLPEVPPSSHGRARTPDYFRLVTSLRPPHYARQASAVVRCRLRLGRVRFSRASRTPQPCMQSVSRPGTSRATRLASAEKRAGAAGCLPPCSAIEHRREPSHMPPSLRLARRKVG